MEQTEQMNKAAIYAKLGSRTTTELALSYDPNHYSVNLFYFCHFMLLPSIACLISAAC